MAALSTAIIAGAAITAGASIYTSSQARKEAKKAEAKQAALIKKQEEKIAAEKEKQMKEAQARRQRSQTQELLTGTETGIEQQGSLLAPQG